MTIAIVSASSAPTFGNPWTEYKGVFTNDATALISTTVTSGGPLNANTVTVASITGFLNRGVVSIDGGGNAGGTLPLEVMLSAAPAAGVLTFAAKVKQAAGLTVGANVRQMLGMTVPFKPRKIRLLNLTDGVSWEWVEGMAQSTAIKTVWSTGVTTLEASGGPFNGGGQIFMPQSLLGISKTFAFDIEP